MALSRILISALALAPATLAAPAPVAGKRSDNYALHPIDQQLTVYDPHVPAETTMPGQVVYVDDKGEPDVTTTEMIVVMPTKAADAEIPHAKVADNKLAIEAGAGTTTTETGTTATVTKSDGHSSHKDSSHHGHGKHSGHHHHHDDAKMPEDSNLYGVAYAPYRGDHACKSAEDVADDFKHLAGKYSTVRTYGTDCDQVPNVMKAAKDAGMKVMLGIWDINQVDDEASKIVDGVDGDWDMVHSVGVGNELVNNGQATPSEVTRALSHARNTLRSSGYQGPVVTVDTFLAMQDHPELCEESDYCAINAHAFFDSTMDAKDAGNWLKDTVSNVKNALSKPMKIVVTESGWPTDGVANGKAVPGMANQKLALGSIRDEFADDPSHVFLFSAFNDLWKTKTMATFDTDQHWGIDGKIANCDISMGMGS